MDMRHNQSSTQWITRLPYMVFLIMVVWFAFNPFSLLDFPLDDAWIHRVYSRSFAAGHGFEYNPGQPEAGSTSPLWSIFTAPIHWLEFLGTDAMVIGVKLAGVALSFLTLGFALRIAQRVGGTQWIGVVMALVMALDPRLSFSALSGMETGLLLTFWLGMAAFLLEQRILLATLLASLMPTARPEALVILPIFALALGFGILRKEIRTSSMWYIGILPLPMVAWCVFCKMTNGHWLPTTFYMKSSSLEIGQEPFFNAWTLLGANGPLPSLIVIFLLLATATLLVKSDFKKIAAALLLIVAPLTYLIGVLLTREFFLVGYYWIRWTDPAVIVMTGSASLGAALLLADSRNWKIRTVIALLFVISIPHLAHSAVAWRNRLISDSRAIRLLNVQAGQWLNQKTAPESIIAVNDAGATRYFSQRKTIDLMGLNCADIAFKRHNPENDGIVDYLAITPTWFHGTGIHDGLPVCTNFTIPADEYTITSNKGQREIVIFSCR